MNLRAVLPVGTLGLLLSACSAAGDGQPDSNDGLSNAGSSTVLPGAGGGTTAPPVGAGGATTTGPTGTTTPPVGAGGYTAPPVGAGGSTVVTPGAGGAVVLGGGGTPAAGGAAPTGAGGGTSGPSTGFTPGANDGPGIQLKTIKMVSMPLPPGAEEVKCQNFDNPLGGKDQAVVETDSTMVSSHHMFVFHDPSFKDTNAVADCSGIEFHDLFHMAQNDQQYFVYPPNVGRKLLGTDGIRLLVHLLNTTTDAKTAEVSVTFHYGDTTAIKNIAVSLFLNTAFLSVPPGMSTQTRTSGALPATANLLAAVSHMHSRAVNFTAKSSDGVMIYQGTQWNEPVPTFYQAPYPQLKQGTTIQWACTYNNNTGTTLTFGESANTNEMCILAGVVWPDQAGLDLGTGFEWVI
ncbi:MAG TPA: hypothetical protein VH062_35070 [Polyangiaceae bacterium]|jgi:hypothetical protein|nr:hypothetical protein [Polyangiaceae bacterium]